jgi:integrase
VNKEKAALSKMFQVLMELRHVEINPARLVKNLSEKSGERQVYISRVDFIRILDFIPDWFRPIAQTAYYTGMRRGEVVGLTSKTVNLKKRMILLGPEDVKEGHWKRVSIHQELVPIPKEAMKVRALERITSFFITASSSPVQNNSDGAGTEKRPRRVSILILGSTIYVAHGRPTPAGRGCIQKFRSRSLGTVRARRA